MPGKRASETARAPVTRDRALRAAVAVADADGIDALSMRRLAGELGVEAMSLYHHVSGKDDILDGMVDVVIGEIDAPAPGAPWRQAMRARAESTRRALARHPWAVSLMVSRSRPGSANLHHLDAVIGCLRGAGFSMPMTGHVMSLLDSYVYGFAVQEASLPFDASGDIGPATEEIIAQQQAMAETFPHLAEMAETLILRPGYSYRDEFDHGLDTLLDAVERSRLST